MQFDLRQLLMLMVLIGLISGLAISVSVKPVTDIPKNIDTSVDGQRVATVSWNGRVTLYDQSNDVPVVKSKRVSPNHDFFSAFAQNQLHFIGNDKIAVVVHGMYERSAYVWDLSKNEVTEIENLTTTAPTDLYVDSSYLIRANTATGSVTIQDLRDGGGEIREVKNLKLGNNPAGANPFGFGESQIEISEDGKTLMVVSHNASGNGSLADIHIVDAENEKEIASKKLTLEWNSQAVLSPQGNYVAFLGTTGQLNLLDKNLKSIGSVQSMGVTGVQNQWIRFSPDDELVAVRNRYSDHSISIYETATLKKVSTIEIGKLGGWIDLFNSERQSVFAFSQDSTQLHVVPGSSDEGLMTYDILSGERVERVGRVFRFLPGCLFGVGFCLWGIAWGLLARWNIRKQNERDAYSQDDVEFDADTITASDLVADDESEDATGDGRPNLPPVVGTIPPVMIGYDQSNNPVTPAGIKVAWVLMIIGGVWGVFYASIGGFYITMTGIFSFEVLIYGTRIVLNLFLLISSLLALSRGAGRYTSKMILASSFQMISIICCDFLNFSLGLVALICCSTGNAPHFLNPKKPRIGSIRK